MVLSGNEQLIFQPFSRSWFSVACLGATQRQHESRGDTQNNRETDSDLISEMIRLKLLSAE